MKKFLSILCLLGIVACSGDNVDHDYPLSAEDERKQRHGRITGEGITLFGGSKGKKRKQVDATGSYGSTVGLAVNPYLWRASLDTITFLPIASSDPVGGVLITDWYENPEVQGERFKVNVLVLDNKLRADALRVSVFKQTHTEDGWRDAPVRLTMAQKIENRILTRARELYINQAQ